MRFSLVNIGCKVNRVEIDAVAADLLAHGAVFADEAHAPDVVLINTCTVTGEADKKCRKAVRHALRTYPDVPVLVMGCAVAIDPQVFLDMDQRVRVVGKAQAAQVARDIFASTPAEATSGNSTPSDCPDSINDAEGSAEESPYQISGSTFAADFAAQALRTGASFNTRVGIKVQDGCDNACTYCIVHVARGISRSMSFDGVIHEAEAYAQAGVRELVLTGINIGAYRWETETLASLLRALGKAVPDTRIRISSIEPADVDEELIQTIAAADGTICRHLHLPLQSGSTKVLSEMNRPYSAEDYLALVARLRSAIPSLSLSTDIIVGFPGETEEDFAATLAVAREAKFSKIHVFRYSKRMGTPAASRSDQVPAEIVARRAKELQACAKQLRLEDRERRLGTLEWALIQADGVAMTESYHELSAPPDASVGSLMLLPILD